MAPSTLERKDGAWLEGHAHEWVAAGLISPDQAESIRHFEHLDEPVAPQRLTIATEVAAYLGSVLAIMGGAVAVGQSWDDLTVFGRVGIAALIALIGFLAGTWLMRFDEAGAARLGSYLWLLGTAGVAMGVAVVIDELDERPGGWLALGVGLPVLAIGLLLWRNLDRPLQFLTAAVGFGFSLGGIGALTDVKAWWGGIALLCVGLVVSAGAAVHRLQPRLIVVATGSFGAFIGGFMLSDYNRHLGPTVALLIAAAVVVFALNDRLVPLLVLGVIGALVATQALLATTFTGAISSMIVALIGLAIVVTAMMHTRGATPS